MKTSLLGAFCTILIVAISLSSCSKEGSTGPAGPAGATGATGAQGVAGPAGTANVIYSAWLDVPYGVDTVIVSNGIRDTTWIAGIQATKLTTDIVNRGEIKVYVNIQTPANPAVVPLPYNYGFDYIQPYFFVGGIQLSSNEDYGTFTFNTQKYFQYRYILIPGGTTARSAINWNNYEEVKHYLNIKD